MLSAAGSITDGGGGGVGTRKGLISRRGESISKEMGIGIWFFSAPTRLGGTWKVPILF